MNELYSFEEEHRLSQQFDSPAPTPERETDPEVWGSYQRIRHGLQHSRIPDIERADLRQAMVAAAYRHPEPVRFNRLVWAFAAAAGIVLFVSWVVFQTREHTEPVIAYETLKLQSPGSPNWLPALQKNRLVTILESATLTLADHSTLTCVPGTRLAIEMEPQRVVTLQRGKIALKVEPKEDVDFRVKTPLLEVVVVGTEFEVEILLNGSDE